MRDPIKVTCGCMAPLQASSFIVSTFKPEVVWYSIDSRQMPRCLGPQPEDVLVGMWKFGVESNRRLGRLTHSMANCDSGSGLPSMTTIVTGVWGFTLKRLVKESLQHRSTHHTILETKGVSKPTMVAVSVC